LSLAEAGTVEDAGSSGSNPTSGLQSLIAEVCDSTRIAIFDRWRAKPTKEPGTRYGKDVREAASNAKFESEGKADKNRQGSDPDRRNQ
jgi:hypothetical protein